jgi:hypothetical protein
MTTTNDVFVLNRRSWNPIQGERNSMTAAMKAIQTVNATMNLILRRRGNVSDDRVLLGVICLAISQYT